MKSFIWPENTKDARAVQVALKDKVKTIPLRKKPELIAGVDAAFSEDKVIGVTCLYTYPELTFIEEAFAVKKISFPYVPGFLSFREGPAIVEALNGLALNPDVILFDGQGIAHPKGLGLASHIGVLLDIPTIGCAKSRLVGEYNEPGLKKGAWSPLIYHGKVVGSVLRTRDHVRPVFVSPGHRIDLRSSLEIVLGCTRKFRIPEPLRIADFVSKELRREKIG